MPNNLTAHAKALRSKQSGPGERSEAAKALRAARKPGPTKKRAAADPAVGSASSAAAPPAKKARTAAAPKPAAPALKKEFQPGANPLPF